MKEEYYVYAYLDQKIKLNVNFCDILFKYRPIYIGKGKRNRMYTHLKDRKRFNISCKYKNNMFYNKLNKMINNHEYPLIVKLKVFENEADALDFEKLIISEIKTVKNGGLLYNTTDGGLGVSGYHFSEESKKKMRIKSINENHYLRFPDNKGKNHPMYGKKHTEESKKKMSEAKINKKQSKEWIEKRMIKLRGIPLSDDHKRKLSESSTGKKLSDESKRRISESKIGSKPWNYGIIKDIILQINFDGNIVKEWNSLIELEKAGYQKSNVINVCNGKRKSHKGFKWMYKNMVIFNNQIFHLCPLSH